MRIVWSFGLNTALLLALLIGSGPQLLAQTAGRTWVDPPSEPGAAPQAPPQAAEPQKQAPSPSAPTPAPQTAAPPPVPAAPPTQSAQPQKPAPAPAEAPAARQSAEPARPSPPPQPAPSVTTAQPQGSETDRRTARTEAAKAFAIRYLDSWSAPNDAALEATAELYAPEVLFHGRTVSLKRLFNEKRRFVRRWPEREYRPREDAMGAVCNPSGDVCTVHTVFDFTAANPARRRLSEGSGALQLIVQFIGDKPVIVGEHSSLLGQSSKRNLAQEGNAND